MRLLMHNLLQSHVKGVKQGYPLTLTVPWAPPAAGRGGGAKYG